MTDDGYSFYGKAIRTLEQSIMVELKRDAAVSHREPDRRALEAKIEQRRNDLMRWEPENPELRQRALDVLDAVSQRLRARIKG